MARQYHVGVLPLIQVLVSAFLLVYCEPAKLRAVPSQAGRVAYELQYGGANDPRVSIRIAPESPLPAPTALVIPRSYPGGYSFVPYDDFVENVSALSPDGHHRMQERRRRTTLGNRP
jgi:hypothetical protein